ncbi:MAG: right-handed parallel beta-helix repeat-containing protein [Solirubrobacterales bacterium]
MEARRATQRRGVLIVAIAIAAVAILVPALALAHVERASYWPNPAPDKSVKPAAGGYVPKVRKIFSALNKKARGRTLVVCTHVPSKKARKHASFEKLSKSGAMKPVNKGLKRARKHGFKVRQSQLPIHPSKKRIRKLHHFNVKLLRHCRFSSIQAAVNAAHNNDRVEVMPGLYTEPKSRRAPTDDPKCANLKITNDKSQVGAVSYAYQFTCPNDQNLIAVIGRSLTNIPVPQPPLVDRHNIPDAGKCIRCNLQIQGTGVSPDDVVVDAGRVASGNSGPIGSVKDVGIRADRADGFVLNNVTVRHAREHDVYIIETDGSHLNRFKVPYAGEYGVLTFVADHSLIENCDAWGSGDSGLYPGASADLGEAVPPSQRRYGTELRYCDMHHNTLGYSGTDGNAVWVHNNNFYDNSEGFSTDVFTAPGHPGFPQDSDLLEHNNFFGNNFNTYLPPCPDGHKPGPNGPNQGCSDVVPTEPVPVGTGMWIAGGNANVVRNNHFWDNWRRGAMLFAVPDAFACGDTKNQVPGCDPTTPGASATSYRNHFFNNAMGRTPKGKAKPNGVDFWWDQGGIIVSTANSGNCWYSNTGSDGKAASVTGLPSPSAPPPDNLPSDCNNSPLPGAQHGQVGELLACSELGAKGCPWFTTPNKP